MERTWNHIDLKKADDILVGCGDNSYGLHIRLFHPERYGKQWAEYESDQIFAELLFFRFDSMDIGQQTFIITELNFFIRKLAHFTVIQLSEWLFIRLWYLRALSSDTRGCARLQYVHCTLLPMKYTSILCQNEQCV